jgi:anti-sigma factor ChrR (cupin superfamily)
MMRVNAALNERVVVDSNALPWLDSPLSGVQRRPLERFAAESGRTTSIVRYAPGSSFRPHQHPGGEEILVLEGVFSDEHGDYPAGYWLKNPPGSQHQPSSAPGCLLFVKLCYQDEADQAVLRIDTRQADWRPGQVEGMSVLPLHSFGTIHTALVRWEPGATCAALASPGGLELLVLEGMVEDEQGSYPAGSWLRSPQGSVHGLCICDGGLAYIKIGQVQPSAAVADYCKTLLRIS